MSEARPGTTLARLLDGGAHLSVGIMAADLLHLGDELALLETGGAGIVHVDVADGVFSPLFTTGTPLVKAIRTPLVKDVHLMVEDPLPKVEAMVAAGADMVTFQLEGARQPHRVLQVLGQATNANDAARGIVRGVALDPHTPVEALEPLIGDLEYVLILAINPGWGGQGFLPATAGRIERARRLIAASGRSIALGVDGAVTRDNAADVARLGVDVVVSGSAIFDGAAATRNLATMLDLVGGARSAG